MKKKLFKERRYTLEEQTKPNSVIDIVKKKVSKKGVKRAKKVEE